MLVNCGSFTFYPRNGIGIRILPSTRECSIRACHFERRYAVGEASERKGKIMAFIIK